MSKRVFLSLILMGYGFTIFYGKADKDHNPKSKNYNSDRSVRKFRICKVFHEYSDWQITFYMFYNYSLTFRLNMNR